MSTQHEDKIPTWQQRYEDLSNMLPSPKKANTLQNELRAERHKSACRDAEIADLRAALARKAQEPAPRRLTDRQIELLALDHCDQGGSTGEYFHFSAAALDGFAIDVMDKTAEAFKAAQEPAIPEGDRLDMIAAQAARDVGGIFTDSIAIKSLVVYARAVIRNFVAASDIEPQEPAVKAGWISVEDRLPEVGQEVLVYRPKSERGAVTALARLIRYEGASDYYWDNSYPGKGNMHLPESITHWQSMPDGPAKETTHV